MINIKKTTLCELSWNESQIQTAAAWEKCANSKLTQQYPLSPCEPSQNINLCTELSTQWRCLFSFFSFKVDPSWCVLRMFSIGTICHKSLSFIRTDVGCENCDKSQNYHFSVCLKLLWPVNDHLSPKLHLTFYHRSPSAPVLPVPVMDAICTHLCVFTAETSTFLFVFHHVIPLWAEAIYISCSSDRIIV